MSKVENKELLESACIVIKTFIETGLLTKESSIIDLVTMINNTWLILDKEITQEDKTC